MRFTSEKGNSPFHFLLFLPLLASLHLFASPLEILRPADKSVIDESEVTVVVKVTDPTATKIIFSDGYGKEWIRDIKAGKQVYCQTLNAKMGENRLSATVAKGEVKQESRTVLAYYRSEIFSGFQEEPSGYKKNYFHSDKEEQLCKTCHAMTDKQLKRGEVLENPEDSVCVKCHKGLITRAKGHAPAVNGMCTECHTGKGGEYNSDLVGKSKYVAPDPIMNVCFTCHENVKQVWFARKSEHGPVRDGRCNRCHNPHSSDEMFFTRKPIWDLCTTCHSEKASGAHVISSFVRANTHPTRGKPDPARPGRELVCSGCHDPHGSEGIFLLRAKGQTAFSVCKRCHQK